MSGFDGVASGGRSDDYPEIPGVALFVFWSALIHVVLILMLSDYQWKTQPDAHLALQIRLAPKEVASSGPPFPDLFAEHLQKVEANFGNWNYPLQKTSASVIKGAVISSTETVSARSAWEYYHKSSELDEQPAPLRTVTPAYPDSLRTQQIEGYSRLLIFIDETGAVRNIEVLESAPDPLFGEIARAAFQSETFLPGKKAGLPVKSRFLIKIDFRPGVEFALETP